jgi:uncharacterized protein YndB with AHSA1/START domain
MEWTGARYADGPTVEVAVHIDADPEKVWDVVADPRLMPLFSEELQSVEWLDDNSAAAAGARFEGTNAHPSFGEWTTTSFVVDCERPRRFGWAVTNPDNPSASWRFTLAPENGGTRLTQWMQLGPARSGLNVAIDAMPDKEEKIVFVRLREHETNMVQTLQAIKARVEESPA